MTGPTDNGCRAVEELAAELALGLLEGPERAAALAHLDSCPACRELVATLSRTGDAVLVLAPGGEPMPGFETRVLERLVADGAIPPAETSAPSRRWLAPLAAVAAALILIAGVAVGRLGDRDPVLTEAMRTPEGDYVGEVVVGGDERAFVFVAVPGWVPREGSPRVYVVRIELVDGDPILVDGVTLQAGSGAWGTMLDVHADEVAAVAVLGTDGKVWCAAEIS